MSKLSSENVNMMSSFAMMKKKRSYFEINYNRNNSIVFKVLHIKLHLSPSPTDDSNYEYTNFFCYKIALIRSHKIPLFLAAILKCLNK